MIQTEKALDMLPHAAEIYEKLDLQNYIQKNFKQASKDDNVDELRVKSGVSLMLYVVKNSKKIKTEMLEIVAIAQENTMEEVKKQPLTKTIETFKNVFADSELVAFFKEAMK
ncbi:hypothetical protein FZC76_06835 [Sutcliffiella horikoshii]|uniref:Uncharacterized protein n=1 Tax=Sutcliffiella horikoshii TaxID=79883 RepID=A0A5D4SYX6_9BACI|nr:hypothetical protein [Sutcliffiella horikoshii]TYS68657.1 hypothetical protein FZC76_06835 [Sutcliffiella horikoshii]